MNQNGSFSRQSNRSRLAGNDSSLQTLVARMADLENLVNTVAKDLHQHVGRVFVDLQAQIQGLTIHRNSLPRSLGSSTVPNATTECQPHRSTVGPPAQASRSGAIVTKPEPLLDPYDEDDPSFAKPEPLEVDHEMESRNKSSETHIPLQSSQSRKAQPDAIQPSQRFSRSYILPQHSRSTQLPNSCRDTPEKVQDPPRSSRWTPEVDLSLRSSKPPVPHSGLSSRANASSSSQQNPSSHVPTPRIDQGSARSIYNLAFDTEIRPSVSRSQAIDKTGTKPGTSGVSSQSRAARPLSSSNPNVTSNGRNEILQIPNAGNIHNSIYASPTAQPNIDSRNEDFVTPQSAISYRRPLAQSPMTDKAALHMSKATGSSQKPFHSNPNPTKAFPAITTDRAIHHSSNVGSQPTQLMGADEECGGDNLRCESQNKNRNGQEKDSSDIESPAILRQKGPSSDLVQEDVLIYRISPQVSSRSVQPASIISNVQNKDREARQPEVVSDYSQTKTHDHSQERILKNCISAGAKGPSRLKSPEPHQLSNRYTDQTISEPGKFLNSVNDTRSEHAAIHKRAEGNGCSPLAKSTMILPNSQSLSIAQCFKGNPVGLSARHNARPHGLSGVQIRNVDERFGQQTCSGEQRPSSNSHPGLCNVPEQQSILSAEALPNDATSKNLTHSDIFSGKAVQGTSEVPARCNGSDAQGRGGVASSYHPKMLNSVGIAASPHLMRPMSPCKSRRTSSCVNNDPEEGFARKGVLSSEHRSVADGLLCPMGDCPKSANAFRTTNSLNESDINLSSCRSVEPRIENPPRDQPPNVASTPVIQNGNVHFTKSPSPVASAPHYLNGPDLSESGSRRTSGRDTSGNQNAVMEQNPHWIAAETQGDWPSVPLLSDAELPNWLQCNATADKEFSRETSGSIQQGKLVQNRKPLLDGCQQPTVNGFQRKSKIDKALGDAALENLQDVNKRSFTNCPPSNLNGFLQNGVASVDRVLQSQNSRFSNSDQGHVIDGVTRQGNQDSLLLPARVEARPNNYPEASPESRTSGGKDIALADDEMGRVTQHENSSDNPPALEERLGNRGFSSQGSRSYRGNNEEHSNFNREHADLGKESTLNISISADQSRQALESSAREKARDSPENALTQDPGTNSVPKNPETSMNAQDRHQQSQSVQHREAAGGVNADTTPGHANTTTAAIEVIVIDDDDDDDSRQDLAKSVPPVKCGLPSASQNLASIKVKDEQEHSSGSGKGVERKRSFAEFNNARDNEPSQGRDEGTTTVAEVENTSRVYPSIAGSPDGSAPHNESEFAAEEYSGTVEPLCQNSLTPTERGESSYPPAKAPRLYSPPSDRQAIEQYMARADELRALFFLDNGPDPCSILKIYEYGANFGSIRGMLGVASLFLTGAVSLGHSTTRIPRNLKTALKYVNMALKEDPNHTSALNLRGDIYCQSNGKRGKIMKNAMDLYTKSAELGDVGGMFRVGKIWYDKFFMATTETQKEKCCRMAIRELERADEKGCGKAASFLGSLFENSSDDEVIAAVLNDIAPGEDTKVKAVELFQRSMDRGTAEGANDVAACYEVAYGPLEGSFDMAKELYEKAFRMGYLGAAVNLALLYELGGKGRFHDRIDPSEALKWYRLGHRMRCPRATHYLAVVYDSGSLIEPNTSLAEQLYTSAVSYSEESGQEPETISRAQTDLSALYVTSYLLQVYDWQDFHRKLLKRFGKGKGTAMLTNIRRDLALVVGTSIGAVQFHDEEEVLAARDELKEELGQTNYNSILKRVRRLLYEVQNLRERGIDVNEPMYRLRHILGEEGMVVVGLQQVQDRFIG